MLVHSRHVSLDVPRPVTLLSRWYFILVRPCPTSNLQFAARNNHFYGPHKKQKKTATGILQSIFWILCGWSLGLNWLRTGSLLRCFPSWRSPATWSPSCRWENDRNRWVPWWSHFFGATWQIGDDGPGFICLDCWMIQFLGWILWWWVVFMLLMFLTFDMFSHRSLRARYDRAVFLFLRHGKQMGNSCSHVFTANYLPIQSHIFELVNLLTFHFFLLQGADFLASSAVPKISPGELVKTELQARQGLAKTTAGNLRTCQMDASLAGLIWVNLSYSLYVYFRSNI